MKAQRCERSRTAVTVGVIWSMLAVVRAGAGTAPPELGVAGRLFAECVRLEGKEYGRAREALAGEGAGVLAYLTNQKSLGKTWQERMLAELLLVRFNRKEEFGELEADFHGRVLVTTCCPPLASVAWEFHPMHGEEVLLPEDIQALEERPWTWWSRDARVLERMRQYWRTVTLERTEHLQYFLLEVLLKGWWEPPVPRPEYWRREERWGDVHRYQAAGLLGKLKGKRAFEVLMWLFQDEKRNKFLRAHAARGLGYFGDAKAIPALREAFLSETKRLPAEVWTREPPSYGFLAHRLARELRGSGRYMASEASSALERIRGSEAVAAWVTWLGSDDPQCRLVAVDYLKETGGSEVLAILKRAAADHQDPNVREAARSAAVSVELRLSREKAGPRGPG